MSRVRDNLTSTSNMKIDAKIGKFAVTENNDIKSGDFVKYVSKEVSIVNKTINKECVTGEGTIEQYTEVVDSGVIIPPNNYYLFNTDLLKNIASEKIDEDRVLILYTDDTNTTYIKIGNIDVSTGAITYGIPVKFITSTVTDVSIIKTTVNRVFISYKVDNVYRGAVVNVTGNAIVFSNDFDIVEDIITSYSVALLEYNKIMIAYIYDDNIYVRVYNVMSDTIILIASRIYSYSISSSFVNLTTLNDNRVLLSYVDNNKLNRLSSVLVSFSIVTINFGDPFTSSNIINPINLTSTKLSNDSIYISYNDINNVCYIATINIEKDDTIKFSDITEFATESQYPICRLISTNKVATLYQNITDSKLCVRIHDLNVGLISNQYVYSNTSVVDKKLISINILDNGYIYVMFGEVKNDILIGNSCLLTISLAGLYTEVSNQFYDFIIDDIVKPIDVNKYKLQFNSLTEYTEEERYHSIIPNREYINITEGRGNHLNSVPLSDNRVIHIFADSYDFQKGKAILTSTDKDTDISTVVASLEFEDTEVVGIQAINISDNRVLVMYTTLSNDSIIGNCIYISVDDNNITASIKYIFTDENNNISGSFVLNNVDSDKAVMIYNNTIGEESIVARNIYISDDNMSFGDPNRFGTYASYIDSVLLSPNKVILLYNDSGEIGSQLTILNIGDNEITVGKNIRFTTRAITYKSMVKLSSTKVLVTYVDTVDKNIVKSFIARISGTNIIMNKEAVNISDINASYVKSIKVCDNCILFVYKNGDNQLEARLAIIRGLILELHTPLIINYSEGNELCNTDINLIKLSDENIVISLNENIEGVDLVTMCQLSVDYEISISTDIDGIARSSGIGGDSIYVYIPDNN